MDAVEAQEMGVGLDRTQIVDGDDLDVLAARLQNRAQDEPPNPAEAVDRYLGNHPNPSSCVGLRMAADASKLKPAGSRGYCPIPGPKSTGYAENATFRLICRNRARSF